ncbi:MAG: hypothetical protein ABEJ08_00645 [Halobacteriaceae archaeon]
MSPGAPPLVALPVDPILLGLIALFLGFVFFIYLMVRRTVVAFREGADRDR